MSLIQAWRTGHDPFKSQEVWELWERETGLNNASSSAKFSGCTLPYPDDVSTKRVFLGPLTTQTPLSGPKAPVYPPQPAEAAWILDQFLKTYRPQGGEDFTGHPGKWERNKGQCFELAFCREKHSTTLMFLRLTQLVFQVYLLEQVAKSPLDPKRTSLCEAL